MSFEIPISIEPEIREYADAQHITVNEAVLKLLQAGLNKSNPGKFGLGLFGSAEDVTALDAAVALAYEERRQPSAYEAKN